MFTEFHFNVELVQNTPSEVINILKFMISEDRSKDESLLELPDHPLFETDRWRWMLLCDSYYFSADTYSTLRKDDIANAYFLCIRCNLKNYNKEIEKFVDWIDSYVYKESGGFLGFSRYQESQDPTLIRKK